MEIDTHALAHGMYNRSLGRLSAGVTGKPYHGFHCGAGRIIGSPALRDKQSLSGKSRNLARKACHRARRHTSGTRLRGPDCAKSGTIHHHRRLRRSRAQIHLPNVRPSLHSPLRRRNGENCSRPIQEFDKRLIAAAAPALPVRPEKRRGHGRWSSPGNRHAPRSREWYRQNRAPPRAETANPS